MKRTQLGAFLLGLAAACAAATAADTLKALRYGTLEAQEVALDEVLAGRVPEAGPALLDLLNEAKGIDKIKVVRAKGVLRETKAVRPLLELLNDPSNELRMTVVLSLGRIGDAAAAPSLGGLLAQQDPEMREAAASALGYCGTGEDVPALGAALSDPNRMVKLAAVDALGRLGSPLAFPLLKPLLKDADASLKRHVVTAIGALRSTDVDSCLKAWLNDRDPYLRAFSAEALAKRPANPLLEPDLIRRLSDQVLPVQIRAVEALGAWKSDSAVPALIKVLRSSDPLLRLKTVQTLGTIGDPASADPLEYLRDHDAEENIRVAAAEALKGLK